MSKGFKWTLLVVLWGFLGLLPWPFTWLTAPSLCWNCRAAEITPAGDRLAFARAMSTLKEGMTAAQVRDILGAPDDVKTDLDPGGIHWRKTSEIWGYGTAGHLSYPTLGCVYMDETGRVVEVFGGKGTPPDPALVTEAEVREVLRLISRLPDHASGREYNPRDMIQLVNRLQKLGPQKAQALIREYERVAPLLDNASDFVVIMERILFDVPADPGYFAHADLGLPDPDIFEDNKLFPRSPILLADDIPLMLVRCYAVLGGLLHNQATHEFEYFLHRYKFCTQPLQPANAPLAEWDKLIHSPQWDYCQKFDARIGLEIKHMVMAQLLRLVDTVYRVSVDRYDFNQLDQQWDRICAEFGKLAIRWDPQQNIYVFADGSHLPEIQPVIYQRQIWRLPAIGPRARLIIERMDPQHIYIKLEKAEVQDQGLTHFRIARIGVPGKPLLQGHLAAFSGESAVIGVKLPAGASVQAELVSGEKRWQSPVYIP